MSWVISGGRYDDGPLPWGIMGVEEKPHDPRRSGPSCWSVPQATDDEFDGLLAWLREEGVEGYPPRLGLRDSLRAVPIYMRHNEPFSPGRPLGWPGSA